MTAALAPALAAPPAARRRRAPGPRQRELVPRRAIARRPPPRFPVPLLELTPAQWERPQAYLGVEDLHALRDVEARWRPLVRALGRACALRGIELLPVAAAQLLVLYAHRGLPSFEDPNFPSVGSPGVQLSNAVWGEVLGYGERQVIRGWQLLDELQLVVREARKVEILSLGLQHSDGVLADGFLDALGRPHYEAQLPTVTYLARHARALLDGLVAALSVDPLLRSLLQELASVVAPTLRVLERRFGRVEVPAAPSQQQQLDLPPTPGSVQTDCKVTPSPAQLDLDQIGLTETLPVVASEPLSLFGQLPANPVALLTDKGLADGLRWRGGTLELFAEFVARARVRYVWLPQKRLDRRYECSCGLQELERLGRERNGAKHGPECRLLGTAHPTGVFVRVRRVATFASELLPDEWRDRPSFRDRTEMLLADVLLEASRQELRDFDLARAQRGTVASPPSEPLVLPAHERSARARRREYRIARGEKLAEQWRQRFK